MTSFISHTSIDCANAYDLSEWWKPVLGYVDLEGDPWADGIAVIEPDLHRCDSRVVGDIVGTEHVESNVSETVVVLLDEQHPPLVIRKEYFG